MFRRVREGLGDDEIGGCLDGRWQSPVELGFDVDIHGRALGQRLERATETCLGQDRRVQSLRQFAQIADRGLCFGTGRVEFREGRRIGFRPEAPAKQLQRDPERHETLLRAIVEVALDPPPFGVLRLGQPGTGCADRLELGADLGLEPLVLD